MDNTVTEDYCSHEVNILLKDKGCALVGKNGFRNVTHSIAIKWIRKNFGIHIYVFPTSNEFRKEYVFSNSIDWIKADWTNYEKYEEATEAGLKYTLTNLIK